MHNEKAIFMLNRLLDYYLSEFNNYSLSQRRENQKNAGQQNT
jgi:hypothetical protein